MLRRYCDECLKPLNDNWPDKIIESVTRELASGAKVDVTVRVTNSDANDSETHPSVSMCPSCTRKIVSTVTDNYLNAPTLENKV